MKFPLRVCFIEYSKLFDCVWHAELWESLKELGFKRIIHLIKALYEGQESAVKLEDGTSEWFKVEKGVRQGCILSPYLFSAYTETIMRNVATEHHNEYHDVLKASGQEVSDLRYADDTALLSGSEQGLQALINTVNDHSAKKGLKLNVKKTIIIDTNSCMSPSSIMETEKK